VTQHYQESRARLRALPGIRLGHYPTPVEELPRLRTALGNSPRLLVKRDDAIGFAFGGNKVRKIELVLADALEAGADTLVTIGGVHSNHVRVTAAAAARVGLGCVLVINGARPQRPTGNARLDELLGAEIRYVPGRADRAPRMREVIEELKRAGRRPYEVPLGSSTPLGAMGYARAVEELAAQGFAPDAIVVSSSSGGTLAGLLAGVELVGLKARVTAVSPDDPAGAIAALVARIIEGMGPLLGVDGGALARARPIEVDDSHVGEGYGIPTPASSEAISLCARREALFLDPTYTAKAMGALIAYIRAGRFRPDQTVLFWHTGGQVELVA